VDHDAKKDDISITIKKAKKPAEKKPAAKKKSDKK
jgi:hypothetical protein